MAKRKVQYETRQVYASIREELYMAAKSKALELRMPMREFIEHALEETLNLKDDFAPIPNALENDDAKGKISLWDDPYLNMQSSQPIGAPVELTAEESIKVLRQSFGKKDNDWSDAGE
jgi:hypothetical protein